MAEIGFTKDKNQVGTPWHIVEFLSELLVANNKRVLDPTAGNGLLLAHAGNPIGIEYDIKPFNDLVSKYPNGHFINGSVFDNKEFIQQQNPELVLMNPPFNADKITMSEEYKSDYGEKGADATKGLYFVEWVADVVNTGILAAIVPVGAIATGKKAIDKSKQKLLQHHTLEAVIKLNSELFYPVAGPQTVVLIFKLGHPHYGETFMVDFSEDGLEKDRKKGRIDKNGTWQKTKEEWLKIMTEKPNSPDIEDGKKITSAVVSISATDEWGPSHYFKRDTTPTYEDFYKTVKEYMDWEIKNVGGLNNYLSLHSELKPSKQTQIANLQKMILDAYKQIKALEPLTDEEIHRPLDKTEYERKRKELWQRFGESRYQGHNKRT